MFSSFSLPTFFFFFFFPVIRSRTPVAPLVNCVVSQKSWTANSEFAVSVCGSGDSEACSDDGFSGILAFPPFSSRGLGDGCLKVWSDTETRLNTWKSKEHAKGSKQTGFIYEGTDSRENTPRPFYSAVHFGAEEEKHLKLECVFFFSTKLALTHV